MSPSAAPPIVVRDLRWGDFPDRMRIYLELYEEVRTNPDLGMTLQRQPPAEADEVGWFGELYAETLRGNAIAVVGEVEGIAAGLVSILPKRLGGPGGEAAHSGVLGILVDRRYRGRGIGEAIMIRALEKAKGKFDFVRLSVFSVNGRARKLYERLGFRVVGHTEGDVKRGGRYLDSELMSLKMTEWNPPAGKGPS